ncbi:MAG: hypothetical protein RLZZ237_1521 [Pseudomonadota bacterium]|jgi:hypothetical protein
MHGLVLLALSTLLAACGGGGGGGDPTLGGGTAGGGASAVPATLTVSLSNAVGLASNTIISGAPLTAKAVVSDKNGVPVSNALVTFSADPGLVSFSTSNGAVLSDAQGLASVTVSAASAAVTGAGKLTATVAAGAVTVSGDANYEVKAAPASASASGARITLSLLNGAPPVGKLVAFATDHVMLHRALPGWCQTV